MTLPAELLDLLRQPSLSIHRDDDARRVTPADRGLGRHRRRASWSSTASRLTSKVRNIERDPRVALTVADPSDPSSYFQVRGRVTELTTDGAVEHIEMLSRKYLGTPYPWYGGRDQVRIKLVIDPEHVSAMR